ncbi:biotin carboxylase N-terminal domain-containing protein [Micromonospora profundi]|uniref:Biotin carboxylase N-terminal domain-containing protein n=1 Tax=Micromonospora profundi TaxID=1420889 RepID=A0AAJ6L5C6_9ACTN|nr:biotin carboxylase N-terminal domain-containing protein [Micromonospora profundi]WLS46951.1 biotin carboxylase N-terminal domain-containing protein [Micromonospora profundi]
MIESLLVANRGEIARRIIRTAKRLGIRAIAVYSEADADLPFVVEADEAVLIGPPNPTQSYRNTEAILAAAKSTGAQAIHPGYGFLSENAEFARTVESAGLIWIGPGADAITAMGDKINARNLMAAAGVPVAPGTTDPAADLDAAVTAAAEIGYPVMVKAAAGGGGMGMGVAADEGALRIEYDKVRAFAERMFGDGSVLIERFFPRVRHVEVQILGLADGRVVALGERECSVQRRNQKLVEESPSPAVSPELRDRLLAAAVRAGEAVNYRNAGTVECLLVPREPDAAGAVPDSEDFFFLEMNTRLQVEHPVTEYVYGVDLVEEQLRVAAGLAPTFDPDALSPRGHAIELRVNAEDPKRFLPGPGKVTTWVEPTGEGIRVDSGYVEGNTVTPFYDSLLAKLIVSGASRDEVIARARDAVAGFQIVGPKNNLPFFAELLENEEFLSGAYDTAIVSRMR